MKFFIIFCVLCTVKYTFAYSKKTEQIIQELTPDHIDKYKIAFESILLETDYIQLSTQVASGHVAGKIIGFGIDKLNKVPQIQKLALSGYTVYEAVESPSTFINYITENPFESDIIKNKAKEKYNKKLIHNINSYITTNAKTLNMNTIKELKAEVHRLQLELTNL